MGATRMVACNCGLLVRMHGLGSLRYAGEHLAARKSSGRRFGPSSESKKSIVIEAQRSARRVGDGAAPEGSAPEGAAPADDRAAPDGAAPEGAAPANDRAAPDGAAPEGSAPEGAAPASPSCVADACAALRPGRICFR